MSDEKESSRTQLEQQAAGQFDAAVGEAIGLVYSSGPGGADQDFKVLPAKIEKRGITITIDAPILTSNEQLKLAALKALKHTAESIQAGVTSANKDTFADHPGHFSIAQYAEEDYYGSGMVPYWEGGLLGSFSITEAYGLTVEMAFMSPYAKILEEGGMGSELPLGWADEKQAPPKQGAFKVQVHPFVGSVARKVDENMQAFGYMDRFYGSFLQDLR